MASGSIDTFETKERTSLRIYNAASELGIIEGIVKKIGIESSKFQVKKVQSTRTCFEVTAVKPIYLKFIYDKRHCLPQIWRIEYTEIQQNAIKVTITTFTPLPPGLLCTTTDVHSTNAAQEFLQSMKGHIGYDILLILKAVSSSTENAIYLNQHAPMNDQSKWLQPVIMVEIAPQNDSSSIDMSVDDLNTICEGIGKYWSGYCMYLTVTATASNLDISPHGASIILSSTTTVNLPKKS